MRFLRFRFIAVLLLATLHFAPAANGALAAKAGGKPRFTARLSSNPVIRRQQLIVDPEGILTGSVSTTYDPAIVHLSTFLDDAKYSVTGGWVGVIPRFGAAPALVPLATFLSQATAGKMGEESGYVRIFFGRKPTTGATRAAPAGGSVIPNRPGYKTVDQDGVTGLTDTHALLFDFVSSDPLAIAAYRIYATPALENFSSDSLTFASDPEHPVLYTQIGSANVRGPLGIPLPPALGVGLVTLVLAIGTSFRMFPRKRGYSRHRA